MGVWRGGGKTPVVVALVSAQVFFGLHYLAAKVLLDVIEPRTWASLRVVSAALILLAMARLAKRPFPSSARDLGRLALYSVFGIVINQVCFVEGLHRTTPSHSSIIMTTIPVGTLLLAVLMRRETLSLVKIAALAVALAGVLLVIRPVGVSVSSATLAGDLLTAVNAMSYALFLVLSRGLLARVDPLGAMAVLMSFGSIGILAVGWPSLLEFRPGDVPLEIWGLGLFIVVFPTAIAHLLNFWALSKAESSLVALFIYLQPLVATTLSALLLQERLGAPVLIGGGLICLGVGLLLPRGLAVSRDGGGHKA